MNKREVGASIFDLIRIVYRTVPQAFAYTALLTVVQGLFPVFSAWILKMIFDSVGNALNSQSLGVLPPNLILLLAIQVIINTLGPFLEELNAYLRSDVSRKITAFTQMEVHQKINSLAGIKQYDNPRFYDNVKVALQGAQFGISNLLDNLAFFSRSLITISTFSVMLVVINPLLAGLVIIGIIPQLYVRLFINKERFKLAYELSTTERLMSYFQYLLSTVPAAKEIRLFDNSNYLLQKFHTTLQKFNSKEKRQAKSEMIRESGSNLISGIVTGGAFFAVIAQAILNRLTIGDVSLYLSTIQSLSASLSNLAFTFSSINEGVLFFSGYKDLMETPQSIYISPKPKSLGQLKNGIEIKNLSFRYPDSRSWVLRNLNLEIRNNESLALVGANGSGKSTLVKLLARLYDPDEGKILWDDCDIRDFDPKEYRSKIGVIFQDFVHYELSVKENIGLGNVKYINDHALIRNAAVKAGIDQAIEKLPNTYEALLTKALSEDGIGTELSGGEWQKIALARLFTRDAELLIFDEPTASLDAESESEIYRYLMKIINHQTCLVISHRLAITRFVDKIAVIENGEIIEYGNHLELIEADGKYAKLFNLQSKQYVS